jgi:tRNA A37 threonylcarbamoyladenosine dehydratase
VFSLEIGAFSSEISAMDHFDTDHTKSTWEDRHAGVLRVWGNTAKDVLQQAHIAIIGIGGVGSWTAEALARCGIGRITLVDGDAVCVTNVNRQIHATSLTVGYDKTRVMKERLSTINPDCRIDEETFYFSQRKTEWLKELAPNVIVDAIDALSAKCLLLDFCVRNQIPVVTSGGGGGRSDPSQIRTGDLGEAVRDPLLRYVRKKLRRDYNFSRDIRKPFQIPCVYSLESPVYPWADGRVCDTPEPGSSTTMDCGNGLGATAMVTGSMGLTLAHLATQELLKTKVSSHPSA